MVYSISPAPKWDAPDPSQMLQHAMDMPFSPLQEIASSGANTVPDMYGVGTAVRGLTTPVGNEPIPIGNPLDMSQTIVNLPGQARWLAEQAGRVLTGANNPPMDEASYRASPYYRKDIPWDAGMTEDRASALATMFDVKQARAAMSDKYAFNGPFGLRIPGIPTMIGSFGVQALDPINYIPIFGEAAQAAAVARFGLKGLGEVASATGFNMAEAAANTAIFGALTADQRQKYGDDISWEAQVSNIAMAAAIGGIVTPVIHGLGGLFGKAGDRAEAKVTSQVETVPNVGVTRAVLNDAVTSLATDGEVRLTPASAATIERLSADVTAKRDAAISLAKETAPLAGTEAKAGKVVITPSGARVEVRPEVVDLSTLQAATGDLQVRDRTRAASTAQVEDIGRNLDPARLMPSIEADRGAPIVGADNIVDSGNGRVAGIRRAYEAYPEQAAAYRKAIEDHGYSTEGMQNPVLISRRVTPLSPEARALFNAEANQPATARMSPTELALMDERAMSDDTLSQLTEGGITAAGNKPFVRRFLAGIPQNERGSLVDSAGDLSADGARRIERALVAAAYGDVDPGVIRRFAEATDDNTLSIVGAMSDVAGKWAMMRRAVKSGEISPEFDVTPELTSGLSKLSRWREQAAREGRPVSTVIKEGMGQLDMLDGEMTLEAKTLIRAFYKTDEFKQGAGRDAIATRLNKVVDAANDLGRPQLFGDAAAATKLGVLQHAINDSETDLFAVADTGAGTDGLGQGRGQRATGADRGNGAQGAGVNESGGPQRSGADAAGLNPVVVGGEVLPPMGTVRLYRGEGENGAKAGGNWWAIDKAQAQAFAKDGKLLFVDIAQERYDELKKLTQAGGPNELRAERSLLPEPRPISDAMVNGQRVLPFPEQPRAPATDMTPPKPELPPEGLSAAAARVGTPERLQNLADQFGVDFATGDYPEQFTIEQMRKSGILSADDEEILAAMDEGYASAEAFGNTLKAALECIL